MRNFRRLAVALATATAALLAPCVTPAASANPAVPLPCAVPVAEDDKNGVGYTHDRKSSGVVQARAGFDLTCLGAQYTFTVTSAVMDRSGLRDLGWVTTDLNGAPANEPLPGASVDITFVGDGLPHIYSITGTVAESYFDKQAEGGLQCVQISLTVDLGDGLVYTWPSDPTRSDVCSGGGATSYFR